VRSDVCPAASAKREKISPADLGGERRPAAHGRAEEDIRDAATSEVSRIVDEAEEDRRTRTDAIRVGLRAVSDPSRRDALASVEPRGARPARAERVPEG